MEFDHTGPATEIYGIAGIIFPAAGVISERLPMSVGVNGHYSMDIVSIIPESYDPYIQDGDVGDVKVELHDAASYDLLAYHILSAICTYRKAPAQSVEVYDAHGLPPEMWVDERYVALLTITNPTGRRQSYKIWLGIGCYPSVFPARCDANSPDSQGGNTTRYVEAGQQENVSVPIGMLHMAGGSGGTFSVVVYVSDLNTGETLLADTIIGEWVKVKVRSAVGTVQEQLAGCWNYVRGGGDQTGGEVIWVYRNAQWLMYDSRTGANEFGKFQNGDWVGLYVTTPCTLTVASKALTVGVNEFTWLWG